MITREQAEQMFHEHVRGVIDAETEVRNITVEEITSDKVEPSEEDAGYDALGAFELEDHAYKCTYECRWKIMHVFATPAPWSYWDKKIHYIVEAKPGPYLID